MLTNEKGLLTSDVASTESDFIRLAYIYTGSGSNGQAFQNRHSANNGDSYVIKTTDAEREMENGLYV